MSIEKTGEIKIIKNESIANRSFSSQNFDESDIKSYLNETYFPTITINKDKVIPHTWSIGAVTSRNDDLAEQINDENSVQSQSVNVGLVTVSEYLRTNSNISQCETHKKYWENCKTCQTSSWIYNSLIANADDLALITPIVGNNNAIFVVISGSNPAGNAGLIFYKEIQFESDIVPSLYLSSDIKITGGDGSQNNPYTIE